MLQLKHHHIYNHKESKHHHQDNSLEDSKQVLLEYILQDGKRDEL